MEAQTTRTVLQEMLAHISKQGGPYCAWYCGIAADWQERLFNDHRVPKDHWYIVRRCLSAEEARKVEKALLAVGCEGGSAGGGESTVYVYAYLRSTLTNP